ncbi:MAG: hypothetical protein J6T59_08615 [Bacteroidales bacterium]|nr:hypothetical protein [Bacteroidales bacterium]
MIQQLRKKNIIFFTSMIIIATSCVTITSCNKSQLGKKNQDIVVTHEFPNTNWAFEERVLTFDFDNLDSTSSYQISFILNYDKQNVTMEELPITVTLLSPDGMETFVTSTMRLKENNSEYMKDDGGMTELEVVAFPKKNLNRKGRYIVKIYRKADKADNYGFNKLSLRVSKLKDS